MMDFFSQRFDFNALGVRDLLEARDAYHVHLANLENVIATAIGRFRIRETDPDAVAPSERTADVAGRTYRPASPERRLDNTVVQPWSWPCLLVFVDRWRTQEEMRDRPDQVVPPRLYLPDGRVVPTCVVLAVPEEQAPPPLQDVSFPSELIGGGYPVLTEVQGREHIGTLACLVSDGDSTYALTNRHVVGEPGRPIYSLIRAKRQQIGVTDAKQLRRAPFEQVYRGWPGAYSHVNLDAGLVRVDDLELWTAQVFGVGEIGMPVDLNVNSLSLNLIGCPVKAFGSTSGELFGEVQALFYRYRTIGGVDYVADLLIGPRRDRPALSTRPGDSGTLWFFDDPEHERGERAERLRPVALQWGGHRILHAGASSVTELRFALATLISTICRELDVDIVRGWNIGHSEYWGKLGHYKVGASACGLAADAKLKKLLTANLGRIAFTDQAIKDGALKRIDADVFVPLSDVPDLVWRSTRRKDDANHFADMDEAGAGQQFGGTTLLDLCQDPANVDAALWDRFYDSLGLDEKRGALPFRVWQLYQAMVRAVQARELDKYVCAAGVLAHYIGDACQPLHVSRLHHGRPDHPEERDVHEVYETRMLDRRAADVIAGVNQKLNGVRAAATVHGGHAAAVATVDLMRRTVTTLPPIDVIEAFHLATGQARVPAMWEALGDRTTTCIAAGSLLLATLWESAWQEGGGGGIAANALRAQSRVRLRTLYNDRSFLPALRLHEMAVPGVLT